MHIEINTDRNIRYDESVERHVRDAIESNLARFAPQVSRVEVHLHDQNAEKKGAADKRCLVEARVDGRPPITASDEADTLAAAITNAAKKLQRRIDSELGRLH
jgi:ribosome-associated translation inhibitor RaiA